MAQLEQNIRAVEAETQTGDQPADTSTKDKENSEGLNEITTDTKKQKKEKKDFWEKTKELFSDWKTGGKSLLAIGGIGAGIASLFKLFKGRSKEEQEVHEKKSWRGKTW